MRFEEPAVLDRDVLDMWTVPAADPSVALNVLQAIVDGDVDPSAKGAIPALDEGRSKPPSKEPRRLHQWIWRPWLAYVALSLFAVSSGAAIGLLFADDSLSGGTPSVTPLAAVRDSRSVTAPQKESSIVPLGKAGTAVLAPGTQLDWKELTTGVVRVTQHSGLVRYKLSGPAREYSTDPKVSIDLAETGWEVDCGGCTNAVFELSLARTSASDLAWLSVTVSQGAVAASSSAFARVVAPGTTVLLPPIVQAPRLLSSAAVFTSGAVWSRTRDKIGNYNAGKEPSIPPQAASQGPIRGGEEQFLAELTPIIAHCSDRLVELNLRLEIAQHWRIGGVITHAVPLEMAPAHRAVASCVVDRLGVVALSANLAVGRPPALSIEHTFFVGPRAALAEALTASHRGTRSAASLRNLCLQANALDAVSQPQLPARDCD